MEKHILNDSGMKKLPSESAVFENCKENGLVFIGGIKVDNRPNAGSVQVVLITGQTLNRFESKPRMYNTFNFFRSQIRTVSYRKFRFGQPYCAAYMSFRPTDSKFEEFRKHFAFFSWLTNT